MLEVVASAMEAVQDRSLAGVQNFPDPNSADGRGDFILSFAADADQVACFSTLMVPAGPPGSSLVVSSYSALL